MEQVLLSGTAFIIPSTNPRKNRRKGTTPKKNCRKKLFSSGRAFTAVSMDALMAPIL